MEFGMVCPYALKFLDKSAPILLCSTALPILPPNWESDEVAALSEQTNKITDLLVLLVNSEHQLLKHKLLEVWIFHTKISQTMICDSISTVEPPTNWHEGDQTRSSGLKLHCGFSTL